MDLKVREEEIRSISEAILLSLRERNTAHAKTIAEEDMKAILEICSLLYKHGQNKRGIRRTIGLKMTRTHDGFMDEMIRKMETYIPRYLKEVESLAVSILNQRTSSITPREWQQRDIIPYIAYCLMDDMPAEYVNGTYGDIAEEYWLEDNAANRLLVKEISLLNFILIRSNISSFIYACGKILDIDVSSEHLGNYARYAVPLEEQLPERYLVDACATVLHYRVDLVEWFVAKDSFKKIFRSLDRVMADAAFVGDERIVKLCISNGATNMNWAMKNASAGGWTNVVALLCENGGDINCALEHGVGHISVITKAIQLGANNFNSALKRAMRYDMRSHIDLLYERGANVNIAMRDAIELDSEYTVMKAIELGANDFNGALKVAMRNGSDKFIDLFYERGVDVNIAMLDGIELNSKYAIVKAIERGADDFDRALRFATSMESDEWIRFFEERGGRL